MMVMIVNNSYRLFTNRNQVTIRTMMCQPIAQNIDFSGSNQIQTPQYPDVHPPTQETSGEVFQANHSIQNEESFENHSNEIAASNSDEEKEIPPQDSDFQLIEECSTEIFYDDDFEDIEYVEASLSDPEIVSVEKENVVQQEENEIDLKYISQIQDVVLREKLLCITCLISNIESLNDNSTPDHVFNSFESDNSLLDNFRPNLKLFAIIRKRREVERLINLMKNDIPDNSSNEPLLEEVDLFLFDTSIPPGIENFADDPEGDIRFLEELLIDDFILSHESSALIMRIICQFHDLLWNHQIKNLILRLILEMKFQL
nr:hypothetical protein [Tanacetum cinerariifolium]